LSAQFFSANQIVVAIGTAIKPIFEKVAYLNDDGTIKTAVKLEAQSSALMVGESPRKSAKTNATIIGPSNMPMTDEHTLETSNALPSDQNEMTLQEKLESLGITVPDTSLGKKTKVPKADSMLSVLVQAIHTKDNLLLESCLEITDPVVVKNTVQKLPATHVLPFLQLVVEKFQSKPSRMELLVWIRSVLMHHTSYLISQSNIAKSLAGLYVTVDNRVSAFPHFLKLSGRLELLLSQINAVDVVSNEAPVTVYQDSDSDDEEAEAEEDNIEQDNQDSDHEDVMDYEEDE